MNAQKTGQWRWVAVGGERVAYYVGVIRGVFQIVARVFLCKGAAGMELGRVRLAAVM